MSSRLGLHTDLRSPFAWYLRCQTLEKSLSFFSTPGLLKLENIPILNEAGQNRPFPVPSIRGSSLCFQGLAGLPWTLAPTSPVQARVPTLPSICRLTLVPYVVGTGLVFLPCVPTSA